MYRAQKEELTPAQLLCCTDPQTPPGTKALLSFFSETCSMKDEVASLLLGSPTCFLATHLDFPTLVSCSHVSKNWNKVMQNEEIWQKFFTSFSSANTTIQDVKDVWILLKGNEDIITSGAFLNPQRNTIEKQIEVLEEYKEELTELQSLLRSKSKDTKKTERKKALLEKLKYTEDDLENEIVQHDFALVTNTHYKLSQKLKREKEEIGTPQQKGPFWKIFSAQQYRLQMASFFPIEETAGRNKEEENKGEEEEDDEKLSRGFRRWKLDLKNREFLDVDTPEDKARRNTWKRNALLLMTATREFVKQHAHVTLPNQAYVFWAFFRGLSAVERNIVPILRLNHVFDIFGEKDLSLFAMYSGEYQLLVREYHNDPPECLPMYIGGGDGLRQSQWWRGRTPSVTVVRGPIKVTNKSCLQLREGQ